MVKAKSLPTGQTAITSFFGGGTSTKPKPTKKQVEAPAKKTKQVQEEPVDADMSDADEHEADDDKGSDYEQEEEKEETDEEVDDAVPEDGGEESNDTEEEEKPTKTKTKLVASDSSNDPPIHRIPAIFDDLVSRVPQIESVVKQLQGRKMRVATMCSGTESPLLALELIRRSIKDQFGLDFEMEHVFSCEIEPFKQAYIERNFSPPLLFRDVCELGQSHAHTAYGALAAVPGDVDMLIAGTSCVDYSNLNNEKQDIDGQGESGRTFRGMLDWVRRHRPPLVILENVCSAPWDRVVKYFAQEDYSAKFMRVDTKNFYIPHTRTRVYLLAVNKKQSSIPEHWANKIKEIQRPASSTLDAFLLPSDDPRIHQARERLVKESFNAVDRRTGRTDWGRCESRHQRARLEEELGSKRPLTNWEDGGYCKLPDFAWNDWGVGQVERVWDLMDISLLRSAKLGVDPSYKTIVWNLSQNVDRTIGSSKMGICPCLTPSMIPYITNRGGPMVGLEALSMQGLPVDELLLTRETEDQLADLAGNAMSTTVVGACMLAALVVGKQLLRDGDDKKTYEEKHSRRNGGKHSEDDEAEVEDVVMKCDKLGITDSLEDHISGEDQLVEKPLDLAATAQRSLKELLVDAERSARLCECEGRKDMTDRMLSRCKDCGASSCSKCGGRPEHNPETIDVANGKRLSPSLFARELKSCLPMALVLSQVTHELLDSIKEQSDANIDAKIWKGWSEAVLRAAQEELRFAEPKRQDIWVVVYQSNFGTLELSLHPQQPEWRFFARPADDEPANSRLRALLEAPVGRLRCSGGLFDGAWEFALPAPRTLALTIDGCEPVPAWEARLGLQGSEFRDKTVHSRLAIAVRGADARKLDRDISGTYVLLDKCGTANGALHRREAAAADGDVPPVFLMLDPSRCGDPKDDAFVFSISKRRLEYGEHRPLICKLSPKWRQSSVEGPQEVEATVPCQWVASAETRLQPAPDRKAFFAVPSNKLTVDLSGDACKSANAVLVCRVPLHAKPGPEWSEGAWKEVDKVHERLTFKALAWLTERVRNDDDFTEWQEVPYDGQHGDCTRCAPVAPKIDWARNEKNKIVAVEDAAGAGRYERALKQRPAPFVTQLKAEDGVGHVRIGINIASLMHRALSRLPSKGRTAAATLAWRLDTDFTPMAKLSLPKFELKSNKTDPQHAQPPDFHTPLRPEQLRSLTWMLRQEAEDAPPFVEEEISEAILEPLNWRVEGRAQRANRVRGGVLADQVGYGKTAITLGLINCTKDEIRSEFRAALKREEKGRAKPGDALYGRIPTKATLLVVPPHLTKQWVKEASKFIDQGSWKYKIVEVASVSQLNKLTVEAVQNADFIVVASNLFKSPNYLQNLSAIAAGGGLPENQDGRYFNARLEETLKALKTQVELLKSEDVAEVWKNIEKAEKEGSHEEKLVKQSKRLKGKSYRDQAMAQEEVKEEAKPKVGKAVPRNGKIMEVVVTKRPTKAASTSPSSPASSATEATTAAEEDSDVPRKIVRPQRIRKKLVLDLSDDEDIEMDALPKGKAKAKAKAGAKSAKAKRNVKTDESSDFEPDNHSEESDAEMDVDDESAEEVVVVKKTKAKAPAKGKGKTKAAASSASEAASSDVDGASSDAMDVDEPKGKGKGAGAKKRKRDGEDEKPPAKKKKRADADPWGLKGLRKVPDDWKKMKAPPFEMFHFARKVVDEYTYLEGKTLSMISNISADRHWVLSGTPPVQDFGALKTISAFLNIHLGVDDDGEGESAKKRKREQTAVEKFHSFREVHSLEWHAHRHQIGQAFLDQFVRQNIAEIDEIPCAEVIEKIVLPAAERAIYLELEHHLRALDMTIKRGKKTESDREKRLAKVLGESNSAEEALLKRCSHFDLETKKDNAMKACEVIVAERKEQLENCKNDLLKKLQVAVETQKKLNAFQPDESLFQEYVRVSRTEGVGDEDATEIVEKLLEKAQAKAPLGTITNKGPAGVKARGGAKGKGKADDGLSEKQREQIWQHREHTHEIRRVTKELTGRVRSLRYFSAVRDLQKQRETPPKVRCHSPQCLGRELKLEEIAVLSSCGHMGCLKCVTEYAEREECIFASRGEAQAQNNDMSDDDAPKKAAQSKTACKAAARVLNVVRGDTLGVDDVARDKNAKHYGLKLEKVIELIKKRIPKDERVLIFVQFPDLMKKVAEALESSNIKFLEIKGSASQRSKNLDKYQNDSSERVLLLNVMDESASGANLTGANHAIFLSPLLAPTQEIYDACETQAIGRVRRYGQTKHVTIWRFLSADTIDTQIYMERTGKLVA